MSFFTGFGVSALIYLALNMAFPVPGFFSVFEEIDLSSDEDNDRDHSPTDLDDSRTDMKKLEDVEI